MSGLLKRLALLAGLCLTGGTAGAQGTFRAMSYNVENLFDCQHDSLKEDREFTPEGERHWTATRYADKLRKVARVILAAGDDHLPDVVGLCEVENDRCLSDLTRRRPLRRAGYRYVMTESSDVRGIDVALLYRQNAFRPLHQECIPIPPERTGGRPTRDILHVAGQLASGDTLDVFVCHMPSRSGGEEQSESFRLYTAGVLRAAADSVMALRRRPAVLIMGDFNDYPSNRSIAKVLGATAPAGEADERTLYNLMAGRTDGTYRYRGEWGVLDHLIVSGSLLRGDGCLRTSADKAHVLRFPFLLEPDDTYGGEMPMRTFRGMKYNKGYSDHLPVCVDFETDGGQ